MHTASVVSDQYKKKEKRELTRMYANLNNLKAIILKLKKIKIKFSINLQTIKNYFL